MDTDLDKFVVLRQHIFVMVGEGQVFFVHLLDSVISVAHIVAPVIAGAGPVVIENN